MNGKMIGKRACVCLLALAGSCSFLLPGKFAMRGRNPLRPGAKLHSRKPDENLSARSVSRSRFSIPMTFEPNVGQADPRVEFVGRGRGLTVFLTQKEIGVQVAKSARSASGSRNAFVEVRLRGGARLSWKGNKRLRSVTNYFLGNDPRAWRTRVPHFARVQADAAPGVGLAVYGSGDGVEYDLRLAPGAPVADASRLRLEISGASAVHLARDGDLVLQAAGTELRMRRPAIYQEWISPGGAQRKTVDGGYVLEVDGSVGFRVGPHDPHSALVIDPSLSVAYATFLGGMGEDAAASVAVDASGKVYVGGTTTSTATFPETAGARLGPNGGTSEFFIAKIDPTASGAASLMYLTFLGGSGVQNGGLITASTGGSVAITGTTTSPDFPVTDSSQPTNALSSGDGNDVAVSEIDPTGSTLVFSTLFGGSGVESAKGTGGIALDSSGDVYIASDTNLTSLDAKSADLPVTSGAYQTTWDGQKNDGFLAVFRPPAQSGGAATLKYCSYLGTNALGEVSIGGIAVDQTGSAYIAGAAQNATSAFPFTNAFQNSYGGGDSDAFLMKISPAGKSAVDLVYATLLGGSGMDQALGVALDSANPPSAYVTGTTQSADFPVHGATPGYQKNLPTGATSNAFLAVIAQGATGTTSLLYSTYLGGSSSDAGQGIAVAAPNAVYIAGAATSWDFPWHDNVQPFNGTADAFVAKLDPTSAGAASLIYATPLGGTSPPGVTSGAAANAVATDGAGHAYVAGATTSADFPTAMTSSGVSIDGFQPACTSCMWSPAASDAFVTELAEGATPQPAISFSLPRVNFGFSPQLVGLANTGEAPLNITGVSIKRPNNEPNTGDFTLTDATSCTAQPLNTGMSCGFDVSFTPTVTGFETAVVSVIDNAPGSPQELELSGAAPGLAASPSSLTFPPISALTMSSAQQVTFVVTQIGQQVLHIDSPPTRGGPDAAQFRLAPPTNGCVPEAASSCVYAVVFAPQAAGSFHAEIDVSYDLSGGATQTLVVPLAGSATAPPSVSVPPSVGFGTLLAGTAGPPQPVTVMNSASGTGSPLAFTTVGVNGTNSSDFEIASNACTTGSTPPGGTCAIQIAFRPAPAATCGTETTRNATLTLSDNAPGSPQTVALTGTAMDFCFSSPSGQAASAPISPGQTATYALDVSSSAGFGGSVALSCAGAPTEGTCALSSSTVSVSPGTPGAFTVNVTTTAPSSGLVPGSRPLNRTPKNPFIVVTILAGICALSGAMLTKKRRFAVAKAIQAGSLLLALGAGLAACGGGKGASDPADPGTPIGTYTITVTATVTVSSTTVTRTVQLPLTVN